MNIKARNISFIKFLNETFWDFFFFIVMINYSFGTIINTFFCKLSNKITPIYIILYTIFCSTLTLKFLLNRRGLKIQMFVKISDLLIFGLRAFFRDQTCFRNKFLFKT